MQFSAVSTGENSKFTEQQARQDQALRAAVMAIQEKRPDCSLEEVEQEMTKEIDVSSDVETIGDVGSPSLLTCRWVVRWRRWSSGSSSTTVVWA